jgi:hypothetical protein
MMPDKGISIVFATICLFLIVALLPALAGTNPLLQRAAASFIIGLIARRFLPLDL